MLVLTSNGDVDAVVDKRCNCIVKGGLHASPKRLG